MANEAKKERDGIALGKQLAERTHGFVASPGAERVDEAKEIALLADLKVGLRDCELILGEHGSGLVECPGEEIPIVFEANVGVLRAAESAPLTPEHIDHEVDDAHGHFR